MADKQTYPGTQYGGPQEREAGTGGMGPGGSRHDVQGRATQVTERMADKAHSTFETARTGISDGFAAVARAMGRASDQLRDEDQGNIANQIQRYVGKAEHAGQYLRDTSPRQFREDFDRFARERPGMVLGGAFILGLVAARFLKSSERHRSASWDPSRMAGRSDVGD